MNDNLAVWRFEPQRGGLSRANFLKTMGDVIAADGLHGQSFVAFDRQQVGKAKQVLAYPSVGIPTLNYGQPLARSMCKLR